MYNINGVNALAILGAYTTDKCNFGDGSSIKEYTDATLESELLSKDLTTIEVKGGGEVVYQGTLDYDELVGETINEFGLYSSVYGQMTVGNTYPLVKLDSEEYNVFEDTYIIPKESLL